MRSLRIQIIHNACYFCSTENMSYNSNIVSTSTCDILYTVRRTLLNSAPTNTCRQPNSAHKRKIPLAYVRFTQSKFPFALGPERKIEKQMSWAGFDYSAFILLHHHSIIFTILLHNMEGFVRVGCRLLLHRLLYSIHTDS